MISPEALEKARAVALDVLHNAVDSDDGSECMDMPVAIDIIAAALQAAHDAAAPKLPDDLAGLVERLNAGVVPCGPYGGITADDVGAFEEVADKAATAIQSLVARNAELEADIRDQIEFYAMDLTYRAALEAASRRG